MLLLDWSIVMLATAACLLLVSSLWKSASRVLLPLAAVSLLAPAHLAVSWWIVHADISSSFCSDEAIKVDRMASKAVMLPIALWAPPMRPVIEGKIPASCDSHGTEGRLLDDLMPWLALNGLLQLAVLVVLALAAINRLLRAQFWRGEGV